MKNVTVTLDEETARWARIEAARREMSVSSLIRQLLRERMGGKVAYAGAMNRFLSRAGSDLSEGTGYPLERSCTSVPVFVDTNVLVYSRDSVDATKRARASEWMRYLWETGEGRLSIQVLQE